MELLNKIIQALKKPFPEEESRAAYFRTAVAVGIFVTLFLYIFRPFDISLIEEGRLLICLGFGTITVISILLYEFVICPLFRLKAKGANFTFGKWILHMIGTMLVISVGNFLFVRYSYFGYVKWEFLPHMMRGTFAIGIFPIVTIGAISLISKELKYQNIAAEINQKKAGAKEHRTINHQTLFNIPIGQIRYVEALQNYVKIGHISANGALAEQTERATLKSILDETTNSPIIQCHRSYLVNRDTILCTSGNAQGLLLILYDCDKEIPVSRSYVPVFRDG